MLRFAEPPSAGPHARWCGGRDGCTAQTILQTGPASGAGDKRVRADLIDHSDVFLVDLDSFYKGSQDVALGGPIQRFEVAGDAAREILEMRHERMEFSLLVGLCGELTVLRLKCRKPLFAVANARFEFFFGQQSVFVSVD